ncbi:MAG: hypothetical protein K2X93_25130 [Candidatus Obscuribacterales bacterium]|nr:hypothetical protein [Candidatus Obscuribacterales bacterium]
MARLLIGVILSAVLWVGPSALAQSKYVFQQGSRQAVEVSPEQQRQQQHQQSGTYYHRGGMGGRGAVVITGAAQQGSRQAPANWRQLDAAASSSRQSGQVWSSVARQRGSSSTTLQSGEVWNSLSRQRGYKATPQSGQNHNQAARQPGHFTPLRGKSDYVDVVQVGNVQRKFTVHLPTSLNRSKPTPVVLVFSGLGMSGDSMIAVTGLSGIANRNDFIVVYGESYNGEWEDGMKNRRADDVGYVNAVLTKLAQTVTVDNHRVYAVGLSNGGYFAQLLACAMPDKIAAVAVVASTAMEAALKRSSAERPVPIVFFIGTEDPLINWGDGRSKNLGKYASKVGFSQIDPGLMALVQLGGWFSVPDVIGFWTAHNHCQGNAQTTYMPDLDSRDGMRVKRETWGSRGSDVVLYTIEGGGHTWPGCLFLAGQRQSSCCQDINTGEVLWEFFKNQSR